MTPGSVARWLPPAVRDAPAGSSRLLDALLAAVDAQYRLLADDIDRLYDDLFIDSCADWAVPYIGELLGLPADAERLEVAFAIALRRRKGTPAALEDFAEVVTGLPARVVEGWQVTTWCQRLGHPPPPRVAALDLRDDSRLRAGTPFERIRRGFTPGGRHSPLAATVVVWPWQVATYVAVEAAPRPEPRRFALHPLGAEAPLYLRPRPLRLASEPGGSSDTVPGGFPASGGAPTGEPPSVGPRTGGSRTGDEADAPVRATYRVLRALGGPGGVSFGAVLTLAADHPLATVPGAAPPLLGLTVGATAVAWSDLRFASLPPGRPAAARPGARQVLVDVDRGQIELGAGLTGTPRATWHRPVPGTLGALASTQDADPGARAVVTVNPTGGGAGAVASLAAAFERAKELAAALDPEHSRPGIADIEIRLPTSDRLPAPPPQAFAPAVARWRIVAPPLATPTIVGDLSLDLAGACVSVEGLCLSGDLLPGPRLRGMSLDGVTMDPSAGQVLVAADAWELALDARRCILGPIRADLAALPITLVDCIVDGRRARLRPCGGASGASPVDADDCIFADGVEAVQLQEGCLRHCFLGPALSAPPAHPTTYRCGPFPAPVFASQGFEAAGYYALEAEPDHPLLSAAGDGGEIGAWHRARRGARLARLRRRVEEFAPLGLRAGVAIAAPEER